MNWTQEINGVKEIDGHINNPFIMFALEPTCE